jgi:hypothetical protein
VDVGEPERGPFRVRRARRGGRDLVVGIILLQTSVAMSKRKGPLDPDNVPADRVKPGATELIELIRRENPTGRALSAREAEARYARKARLQSLLVRRFQDELTVVPEADHPGTVSLRHRGRDACHAVIAALDEDARAWVQLQLDLGVEGAPPSVPRPSGRSAARALPAETPEALVRRAEQEIETYDYEAARQHLTLAVQASGGAAAPAAALLGLLVETLGDDAAALGVEASLSRAALADPRVRGPLALAAARTGAEDKALGLLRGAGDAQTAAVLCALAAAALARGDAERAGEHFDRAKKLDPASAAILGIADDIARARTAAREPAEAELAALLAAGRYDEADKKADMVLSRWPESEPARRARRAIEERRRRDEAARLAAEADEAFAAGEVSLGLSRLRHAAAACGPEREALERRAREIEAAEKTKREAEQVEQACRLLMGAGEREALLSYLELDEMLRAHVRARFQDPSRVPGRSAHEALTALERTVGRDGARVDAVLALKEARSVVERDPEAALGLLGPHAAALERVPEAHRISREAEAMVRARRLRQAREQVRAARAELAADAAAEALSRLDAAILRDLPEQERALAAACAAEAARIVERRRRAEEAERLRAAGRLFEARALAEGQAREAIRAEIRAAFRFEVDDEPRHASEMVRFRLLPKTRTPCWWLTVDGRRIVTAEARDRWVAVRVLHLSTGEVRPTVLFRTPEPLGSTKPTVCGSTLWLSGERGGLVELSMDDWELVDFRLRSDVAGPDDEVDVATLVAGEDPSVPRTFWWCAAPPDARGPAPLRVLDLSTRRVTREMEWGYRVDPIAGAPEGRVVVFRSEACALYTFRGAPASPGRLALRGDIYSVVAHPAGRGLVACMIPETNDGDRDDEDDDGTDLVLAPISPAGEIGRTCTIPRGVHSLETHAASSTGTGLLFVVTGDAGDTTELRAYRADDDGAFSPLWEEPVSGTVMLVQDAGARAVAALAVHDEGASAVVLGPAPPRLPEHRPQRSAPLRECFRLVGCQSIAGAREVGALRILAVLPTKSHRAMARWVEERERDPAATAEGLLEVALALRKEQSISGMRLSGDLIARLAERFPEHPEVRLAAASRVVDKEIWTGARELLTGLDPAAFDSYRAQHIFHLRALVALREHRLDEAAEALDAAHGIEGYCLLQLADNLIEPVPDTVDERTSPISALRHAIHATDACFDRGDAVRVLEMLDRPMIWEARETQSLARLAEAHLQIDAPAGAARVRKLTGLGAVLDALGSSRAKDRIELPYRRAWDEARVAAIVARARAWLDTQ